MLSELAVSPEKAKEIADWGKKHKSVVLEGDGLVGLRHFDAMRIAGEPLLISHKLDTSGAQDYSADYKVIFGETIAQELENAGIIIDLSRVKNVRPLLTNLRGPVMPQ